MLVFVVGRNGAQDGGGEQVEAFLPHEHFVWNGILEQKGRFGEQVIDPVNLETLNEIKKDPWRFYHNLYFDSVDEMEAELTKDAQRILGGSKRRLIVCETSYIIDDYATSAGILQLAERISPTIDMIVGSGWYSKPEQVSQDAETLGKRWFNDMVGEDGPIRFGLIGEIVIGTGGSLTNCERTAIRGAAIASSLVYNSRKEGNRISPPVLVSMGTVPLRSPDTDGMHTSKNPSFEDALKLADDVVVTFQEASSQPDPQAKVIVSGLLNHLGQAHEYIGEGRFHIVYNLLVEWLKSNQTLLIVTTPPLELSGVVTVIVSNLCSAGYANRIMLSNNVKFKTDLTRYGGGGYANLHTEFVASLKAYGLPPDVIQTLTSLTAQKVFSWWEPVAKEPPKKKPRWACDGPCGKTYSAKKDPFRRLEFKYCSIDCMNKHRDQLDQGKDNGKDDRSGNRRAGAGNSTSWGITVGT
mmetsp:Transcript_8744/g.14166  ORF Transcript_8744/g.14166 Transcript_8744/m.14166 type:complete len:467 (-) Transcript_8744:284-1684(-)